MSAVLGFAERALSASGIGGWEFDLVTRTLRWTEATYRIHGLDPGETPTLDVALQYYPRDSQPVILAAMERATEDGTPWDLDLPVLRADGQAAWVRSCGMAVQEGGRTRYLTGTVEDSTARHEIAALAGRLSVVASQMTNAVVMTDRFGQTDWVNDAFVALTGYGLADMLGKPPGTILQGPETDPATVRHMSACLRGGGGFDVEIINYTRSGRPYWIAITCTPLRDGWGDLTGFIAVSSDITARKWAEAEMRREAEERRQAEGLLRDVLEALPSSVTAYDPQERLILSNRAFREMFPICAPFAQPGTTLVDITREAVRLGQYPEAGIDSQEQERWIESFLAASRMGAGTRTLALAGGRFAQAQERRSENGVLVCIRSDTTLLRQAAEELRRQAERDFMTGLANRRGFMTRLGPIVAGGDGGAPASGALMLFDVDHFKAVNDTHGHDVGDALLVEIAARLQANTREDDFAARLGGDEFVAVLPGLVDPASAAHRIDSLLSRLCASLRVGEVNIPVRISAGVTLFPQDGLTPERLLKTADIALYEAKRNGRGRWCFYTTAASGCLA